MKVKARIFGVVVILVAVVAGAIYALHGHQFAVLNPGGVIADRERTLIYVSLLLSVLVVVPVFALTIGIAWRYRASNTKAVYSPELDGNRIAETIWWLIPLALIVVLAVISWRSTHELDPAKALQSSVQPLTIEVVALDWKWLFIYPEEHIATVNYIQFPVDRPVNFQITSDAPMNSFWIPQLGGQIYAMSGMSTHLHLMASRSGDYRGVSANISGRGFAGMRFTARASSAGDYSVWLQSVRRSPLTLSADAYVQLARPSENDLATVYSTSEAGLYDKILMKYMSPTTASSNSTSIDTTGAMPGMSMGSTR
jgi:cytochrome o ubiquinol oxidase subunit 2